METNNNNIFENLEHRALQTIESLKVLLPEDKYASERRKLRIIEARFVHYLISDVQKVEAFYKQFREGNYALPVVDGETIREDNFGHALGNALLRISTTKDHFDGGFWEGAFDELPFYRPQIPRELALKAEELINSPIEERIGEIIATFCITREYISELIRAYSFLSSTTESIERKTTEIIEERTKQKEQLLPDFRENHQKYADFLDECIKIQREHMRICYESLLRTEKELSSARESST